VELYDLSEHRGLSRVAVEAATTFLYRCCAFGTIAAVTAIVAAAVAATIAAAAVAVAVASRCIWRHLISFLHWRDRRRR
jgi:hypothetical protein